MQSMREWQARHGLTDERAAALLGVHRVSWARWKNDAIAVPVWMPYALRGLELLHPLLRRRRRRRQDRA